MFARFLTDKWVQKRYIRAGAVFGDAVSYIYMGECIGFEKLLARWEKWEKEYAKRGFRTLPLDDFVAWGGYNIPLQNLGLKRNENEKPVFHAQIYRQVSLGKIPAALRFVELTKPKSVSAPK